MNVGSRCVNTLPTEGEQSTTKGEIDLIEHNNCPMTTNTRSSKHKNPYQLPCQTQKHTSKPQTLDSDASPSIYIEEVKIMCTEQTCQSDSTVGCAGCSKSGGIEPTSLKFIDCSNRATRGHVTHLWQAPCLLVRRCTGSHSLEGPFYSQPNHTVSILYRVCLSMRGGVDVPYNAMIGTVWRHVT